MSCHSLILYGVCVCVWKMVLSNRQIWINVSTLICIHTRKSGCAATIRQSIHQFNGGHRSCQVHCDWTQFTSILSPEKVNMAPVNILDINEWISGWPKEYLSVEYSIFYVCVCVCVCVCVRMYMNKDSCAFFIINTISLQTCQQQKSIARTERNSSLIQFWPFFICQKGNIGIGLDMAMGECNWNKHLKLFWTLMRN